MDLRGDRVRLRRQGEADDAALDRLASEPAVRRWWADFDAAEQRRDNEDPAKHETGWVIEVDGETVGYIQAWEEPDPEYRHAGIDLFVAAHVQGHGLGPDAIRTVIGWLIEDRGHHRITIDPRADNEIAIRAYAKVGFRPVGVLRQYERGTDGVWHDGLLMELLASDL